MFTGIVRGKGKITSLEKKAFGLSLGVEFPQELVKDLEKGASVAVEGVCLTVVKIEGNAVYFDAIEETLAKTTIGNLDLGDFVNLERSARLGDEIGGHILSGHVLGTIQLKKIDSPVYTFSCPKEWMKYLFVKGFVAIDGMSLTLVDVHADRGLFTVHLIPETLRGSTIGLKKEGALCNLEIDASTQAIVESVERYLSKISPRKV